MGFWPDAQLLNQLPRQGGSHLDKQCVAWVGGRSVRPAYIHAADPIVLPLYVAG